MNNQIQNTTTTPPVMANNTTPAVPPTIDNHSFSGRMVVGLAEMFDLDIKSSRATILVDLMIFGGSLLTLGIGWIVLVFAAGILAYITYGWQKTDYGDTSEKAINKALLVTLLTGIPVPIATALGVYMALTKKTKAA
jgi:hypothetical protein